MKRIPLILILLALAVLAAACDKEKTSRGITVTSLATLTVRPDGSTTEQDIEGTKRIRIHIDPGEHRLLDDGGGVQVTFWLQGSATDTEAATPDPERENTFFFDLPRSDRLKICEYMFYQWTVVYDNSVTSTRGTHVGATSYVMPTSTINADGSISQALCVGPEE